MSAVPTALEGSVRRAVLLLALEFVSGIQAAVGPVTHHPLGYAHAIVALEGPGVRADVDTVAVVQVLVLALVAVLEHSVAKALRGDAFTTTAPGTRAESVGNEERWLLI